MLIRAGRDELAAHLAAARAHMPGRTIRRTGEPRQCRGSAFVDREVKGPGGIEGCRTNVLRLAPDGRIADAVGVGQG